ncbi:MAG: hypothetical protein LBU65_10620 [Planctomycetaceae bacterium]|jgi:hypothetical protein|nr:hypothetical protein [Planctomycetaceae bacterium]
MRKIFYRFAGQTFICYVFLTLLFNTACLSSDLERLENIRDLIASNYGGIYSWDGQAIVRRTYVNDKIVKGLPSKQYTERLYNFTVDRKTGNFISISELRDHYTVLNKKKVKLFLSNTNYLYLNDVFYSFDWYSLGQSGFTVDDNGSLIPEKVSDVNRIAVVNSSLPNLRHLSNYFDPFARIYYEHIDVINEIKSSIDAMKHYKIVSFESLAKNNVGDYIRIVPENNNIIFENKSSVGIISVEKKFVFDMSQKANNVTYEYIRRDAGKVVDTVNWKCNFQKNSGFLIPKKITWFRKNTLENFTINETVDWKLNNINTELPADAFSLQRLGLHRGDSLYDSRTETTVVITGDDFPEPFYSYDNKPKFTLTSVLLIVTGLCCIVLSIILKFINWYKNHRAEAKQ